MTPAAEDAFADFVADCGADCHRIPKACETYLMRYMARFPDEQNLLLLGLKAGLPDALLRHPGDESYDGFLSHMGEKFAHHVGVPIEHGKWTAGAWAFAVGRPVGWVQEDIEAANDTIKQAAYATPTERNPRLTQFLFTAIVVGGGFLGGFLATAFLPLVMMMVDSALESEYDAEKPKETTMLLLFVFVICMMVGLMSAAATWLGWWFGQGREYPWNGFAVAFGAAFTTTMILLFAFPLPVKPFVLFFAVFGATYKTAARGGRDIG
jgi:hypothetical protein